MAPELLERHVRIEERVLLPDYEAPLPPTRPRRWRGWPPRAGAPESGVGPTESGQVGANKPCDRRALALALQLVTKRPQRHCSGDDVRDAVGEPLQEGVRSHAIDRAAFVAKRDSAIHALEREIARTGLSYDEVGRVQKLTLQRPPGTGRSNRPGWAAWRWPAGMPTLYQGQHAKEPRCQ